MKINFNLPVERVEINETTLKVTPTLYLEIFDYYSQLSTRNSSFYFVCGLLKAFLIKNFLKFVFLNYFLV